jgi:hypothetical protein
MKIHVGKAINRRFKELGISKAEFGRRINKTPQNIADIFERESVDTQLLADISDALKFNFFTLFVKDSDKKQLGKIDEQNKQIFLLEKIIKDKDKIIALYEKKAPKRKK